jgi:hypothetical protein
MRWPALQMSPVTSAVTASLWSKIATLARGVEMLPSKQSASAIEILL